MRVIVGKKGKIGHAQKNTRQGNRRCGKGKLIIAGIGPGDAAQLSRGVYSAIRGSQVIVGYKTYIKLLGKLAIGKEVISSGMTEEIKRAEYAIKRAKEGKKVCVISSGDCGVYGMAGLLLELLTEKESKEIDVDVLPGIPASSSCAGLLGSPLMNDFACISLSDILTDRELIMKRVALAAKADFVIVFYNPKGKKRLEPLRQAWKILMKHKPGQTPVGIVRNAYRPGEQTIITELKSLLNVGLIDMFTTIIVGNSRTYIKDKFMITPRGYRLNGGRG